MSGNVQTERSASCDERTVMDGMPCGMTIGQALGSRTVNRMLSDAHLELKRRHMLSLEEIEAAYELSENPSSSVLLTAAKKMRSLHKIHFFDLASCEGDFIELAEDN